MMLPLSEVGGVTAGLVFPMGGGGLVGVVWRLVGVAIARVVFRWFGNITNSTSFPGYGGEFVAMATLGIPLAPLL